MWRLDQSGSAFGKVLRGERMVEKKDNYQAVTLGGGCFWCLHAAYSEIEGVVKVVSGYAGGTTGNPSYEQVCTGRTGHAEVVQVDFDSSVISYEEILDLFFVVHDPTTLNRQGADVGTQYRSAIFYHDKRQKEIAEKKIEALNSEGIWANPIVTELVPLEEFYAAEDYHQDYFKNNPNQSYCQVVINPKLRKIRSKFADKLKTT